MNFDYRTIERVWCGGRVVAGSYAGHWRKDACGAWMCREHYRNERSEFGWKIVCVTGDADRDELLPVNVRNARDASALQCRVTARSRLPAAHQILDLHNEPL